MLDPDLGEAGVFDYEPNIETLNQDPFAIVIPSGNEADFATTAENKRIYGFSIKILVERASRGNSEAEELITDIVDRIIDVFDKSDNLDIECVLMVTAAPSGWSYIFSTKEYRVAEIKLGVTAWYDTDN